jgi:DNA-binding response OmpR family regulator
MVRRVLIIEDNRDLADLISVHLRDLGCEVGVSADGATGFMQARDGRHDLVILDLMLPGMQGLELCRRLRAEERYIPILMLTARSSELDRVLGLEVGADDYITKPFSMPELMARVKAVFRRIEELGKAERKQPRPIVAGELEIDAGRHAVAVGAAPVDLTVKEFELLLHFARNPGQVYTRSQLLNVVWGYGHPGYEHTVNSHINRLRSKIERDPAKPQYILTVWGVGYKFNDRLGR